MLDVRVLCRVVLPGVLSPALFALIASFDELLISIFLARVHAQTLPVRIWNSLNLQVRADNRRGKRIPDPGDDPHSQHRSRPAPTRTTARARLRAKSRALRNQEMARCVADPPQPVSLMIAVSPSDMLSRVSLLNRIMCRKTTVFSACTCISSAYATGQLRAKARWTESPLSSRAWSVPPTRSCHGTGSSSH
jgi:hypothetical protein